MLRIVLLGLAVVVGVFDVSSGRAEALRCDPGSGVVVHADPGEPRARTFIGSRLMAAVRGFGAGVTAGVGAGVRARFATVEWLEKRGMMSATSGPALTDLASGAQLPAAPAAGASLTQTPVSYNYDSRLGLSKLTYNGASYIDGTTRPDQITPWLTLFTTNLAGADSRETSLKVKTSAYDPATKTLTQTFDGATVKTVYTERADGISLAITITNTAPDRIVTGYNLLPFQSSLPEPAFKNTTEGWWVNGVDGTLTSRIDYQGNASFVTNDSAGTERVMGWVMFNANNPGQGHRFRIGTANIWGTGLGFSGKQSITLAPNASDAFNLSLRFAPSTTKTTDALADKIQQTQTQNPFVLNWTDRRMIGQAFPFSGGQPLFKQPTQPGQVPAYKDLILKYARDMAAAAQRDNKQGVVFWDLEGPQQFQVTPSYAYAGDPRIIPDANPYFNAVADQFFQIFKDAGLRVGLTIRPGKLVKQPNGSYLRTDAPDQLAEYRSIISYAKNRWGCTLFYVDCADTTHPDDLKQIAKENPDILLMPEFPFGGGAAYSAFSAPYRDISMGFTQTPADVATAYPQAFSVIKVNDSDVAKNSAAILAGVKRGDIYMGFVGQTPNLTRLINTSGLPLTRTASTSNSAGSGSSAGTGTTGSVPNTTPAPTNSTSSKPPTTKTPSSKTPATKTSSATTTLQTSGATTPSTSPLTLAPTIFHRPVLRSASDAPLTLNSPLASSRKAAVAAPTTVGSVSPGPATTFAPQASALTAAPFSRLAITPSGATFGDNSDGTSLLAA